MSAYIILGDNFYKRITAEELCKIKGLPWRCAECGRKKDLTIDHKLPKSKNPEAKHLLANFQILCKLCNEHKKDSKKKK